MLEKIKLSLRMSGDDFDSEITDLILACKCDLKSAGVVIQPENDPLIIQGVTLYCKGNFGYDNVDSDKFLRSYELLKTSLSLLPEYKEAKVSIN